MLWFRSGLHDALLVLIVSIAPNQSPSLDRFPIGFEHSLWLQFCEAVSPLFVCGALDYGKFALVIFVPKPVPFSQEVFGPGCNSLVCGQEVRTLVVFECCGQKLAVLELWGLDLVDHLQDLFLQG